MSLAERNNGAFVEPGAGAILANERLGVASPVRVLLVDDDDAVRKALRRVLEHRGHSVVACSSGREALQWLAIGGFDALVSDMLMPGMNGLALLRAVREHDLDLPVILVTGNPDMLTATQAVEFGAFQYLTKPVTSERLDQVVRRAATAGRMARGQRECVAGLAPAR